MSNESSDLDLGVVSESGSEHREVAIAKRWRIRSDVGLSIGCVIVGIYIVVAIFAPLIAPYDPYKQDFSVVLASPSWQHFVGTDKLGRDLFSRLIYGARIDLIIAAAASAASCVIGVIIGTISGYAGRWVDVALTRLMDMGQVIPFLVFAPVVLLVFGTDAKGLIIAFALTGWIVYARLARSKTMTLRDLDFVSAAKLGGISRTRLLIRHLVPNIVTDTIVYLTMDMIIAIGAIAALGYLGIGIQAPTPEWGQIMFSGQEFVTTRPWIMIAPGIAIIIFGIGLSLISDSLLARQTAHRSGG